MLYLLLTIRVEDLELWLVYGSLGLTKVACCVREVHRAAALRGLHNTGTNISALVRYVDRNVVDGSQLGCHEAMIFSLLLHDRQRIVLLLYLLNSFFILPAEAAMAIGFDTLRCWLDLAVVGALCEARVMFFNPNIFNGVVYISCSFIHGLVVFLDLFWVAQGRVYLLFDNSSHRVCQHIG